MRILLAEDEVTIARALKVMLEKNKYAVDMETLRKLADAGHDAVTPDMLKETADSVIQSWDMEQVFEEDRQNYDAVRLV